MTVFPIFLLLPTLRSALKELAKAEHERSLSYVAGGKGKARDPSLFSFLSGTFTCLTSTSTSPWMMDGSIINGGMEKFFFFSSFTFYFGFSTSRPLSLSLSLFESLSLHIRDRLGLEEFLHAPLGIEAAPA